MASPVRRDARRYRRRILGICAALTGVGYVVGAPLFVGSVEADLERRVPEELAAAGFPGLTASFDGQDGSLRCPSPLTNPEAARQAAYDVWGVHAIELDRSCRVNTTDDDADDGADADATPSATTTPSDGSEPTTPDGSTDETAPGTTEAAGKPAFDTVAAAVSGSPQLTLLAVLLQESGLATELADPSAQPVTLFAPTDEAFEALPADVLADLRANPDGLRELLLHHTTAGRVTSGDLVTGPLEMADGQPVEVDADGPTIGDAAISLADIEATTGIVHMIDGVLVPEHVDVSEPQPAASVTAIYDSASIVLSGVVSTEAVRATLVGAATEPTVTVDDQLTVDPDVGLDAATGERLRDVIILMRLGLLNGTAGFDGTDVFLEGTYLTEEDRDAVVAAATGLDVVAELVPPPAASETDAVDLEGELNAYVTANPILFEPSSALITAESAPVLDRIAQLAQQFEGISITVEGHTDSDGDPAQNLLLSRMRALSVKQALVERGLPDEAIAFDGFGSEQPVLVDGVEDKDASRRVEFRVEAST